MSNLYYVSQYKSNIISLLIKNDMFIKLVNPETPPNKKITTRNSLLGGTWVIDGTQYKIQGNVFDYIFVRDTTTDVKTFVFVEVTNGTIDEYGFISYNLFVYICTDKTLMRIDNNTKPTAYEVQNAGYATSTIINRVDTLCDCVDRIVNRNTRLKGIGDIEPASRNYVQLYCPNPNYYGKVLSYRIKNLDVGGDDCEN